MKTSDSETVSELIEIFEKINDILTQENEGNWIRGINSILQRLKIANTNTDLNQLLKDIGRSYSHMNRGPGSFSDFMIWRDNDEERLERNSEFQELADRAWKLLDL